MATEIKLLTRLHLDIHGVLPPELWGTFWFSKKKKKKILLEVFSFKEGGVHMGGLAKIGCEGRFNF